jgi:excisionase family DNA binding protein
MIDNMSMEGYISPRAAAELLAVSVKLVYKLAARGELEVLKVGRTIRIRTASLQEFIARNTVPKVERALPAPEQFQPAPAPESSSRRRRSAPSRFIFLPPAP